MRPTETPPPRVSIVLPTYKRAHLLPMAIRSVQAQTCPDWELIVVDDNSPDDTPQVVAGFTDPRIRYVRNEPNLKLPRALNRGHALARGDYLTWTSDDNLYAERAIEAMVERLARGDCDLVWADHWLFSEDDDNGRPRDPRHDKLPDTVQLEKGNHMGACFLYARRVFDALGGYDPELFLVEDYDFFIRASRQFRFAHIGEPLYYFRRDDATLYHSRFADVKASDFLVRFKNGLLDEAGVVTAMATLLLRHPAALRANWLRWLHRAADGRSWRLTRWQQELASRHLHDRLRPPVHRVLVDYREGRSSFGAARDALRAQMQSLGTVAPDGA